MKEPRYDKSCHYDDNTNDKIYDIRNHDSNDNKNNNYDSNNNNNNQSRHIWTSRVTHEWGSSNVNVTNSVD